MEETGWNIKNKNGALMGTIFILIVYFTNIECCLCIMLLCFLIDHNEWI